MQTKSDAGNKSSASITKRILVLSSTYPRWRSDTAPRFVHDLARRYVEKGHIVDVIAPHAPGATVLEQMDGVTVRRYRYFPVRFQTLAYNGGIPANLNNNKLKYLLIPFFLLFQFLAIVRSLRIRKYDLIHAHWLIPQAFTCILALKYLNAEGIPVLCTLHGSDLNLFNRHGMLRVKKWILRKCAHISVVSDAMRMDLLKQGLPDASINVIPMGVDLVHRFLPAPGVHRQNNRIIFVGRLTEEKGVETLINAVSRVLSSMPDVELLVAGDGPLRPRLEEHAGKLGLYGNIRFTGSMVQNDLPKLYSSASIAVMPSLREGLGLVMIEAMGCGCALVASALQSITEVVRHEETGLLFEPGNAGDLARQLLRLLQDPGLARSLAAKGRILVKASFDWDMVSERYLRLMELLCSPDTAKPVAGD